jgi:hypothetical protein
MEAAPMLLTQDGFLCAQLHCSQHTARLTATASIIVGRQSAANSQWTPLITFDRRTVFLFWHQAAALDAINNLKQLRQIKSPATLAKYPINVMMAVHRNCRDYMLLIRLFYHAASITESRMWRVLWHRAAWEHWRTPRPVWPVEHTCRSAALRTQPLVLTDLQQT